MIKKITSLQTKNNYLHKQKINNTKIIEKQIPSKIESSQDLFLPEAPRKEGFISTIKNIFFEMYPKLDPEYKLYIK